MAIEIISRGQLPGKKPYQGTCSYCKTKIKCLQEDGIVIPAYDQRDGPSLAVECPECKATITAYPLRGGSLIGQDQRSSLAAQYDNPSNFQDR